MERNRRKNRQNKVIIETFIVEAKNGETTRTMRIPI